MTDLPDPPEPVSDLEREGIPDVDGSYPGEAATGVSWDGIVAPGDQPVAVDEFGTTAAEERLDEPLALRVMREVPDDTGEGDDWAEEVAPRLVDPHATSVDDEGDLVGGMVGSDAAALSAEESAIHITSEDDAPGLTWDASPDYVGDEAPGGGAGEPPRVPRG